MTASTRQEGGNHYTKLPIQPMRYSMENGLDPLQHTVIKYVTRFRDKGGVQDLRKAIHCLEMLIEHEQGDMGNPISQSNQGVTAIALPVREMTAQSDADGWIDWKGGECPANAIGAIRMRDGVEHQGVQLCEYNWLHDARDSDYDIVAYRLHKPAEPKKAADPHADLRKTWKPGQRWQETRRGEVCWFDHSVSQPMWSADRQYRRHPDDVDGAQA